MDRTGPTMLTQAASRSPTSARAMETACSSLPVVTRITLRRWGVRSGISAARLARQAFAQLARSASILERLAIVHKQNRHFDSEAGLEAGIAVDLDALDARVEFRKFGRYHLFHLAAQLAVVSCVENQLDHESAITLPRIGVLYPSWRKTPSRLRTDSVAGHGDEPAPRRARASNRRWAANSITSAHRSTSYHPGPSANGM